MKKLLFKIINAAKSLAARNETKHQTHDTVVRIGGYAKGDIVVGTVVHVAQAYALIELPSGVVGKLGRSCLRCDDGIWDLRGVFACGDEVEVIILWVDEDGQRLALGHDLRRASFAQFIAETKVGDRVRGTVARRLATQIVVDLDAGVRAVIDGGAMRSDWGTNLQEGDAVEATVEQILARNRFVRLVAA